MWVDVRKTVLRIERDARRERRGRRPCRAVTWAPCYTSSVANLGGATVERKYCGDSSPCQHDDRRTAYKLMADALREKLEVRYRVSEKRNKVVKFIQCSLCGAPWLLYVFSLSVVRLYDRLALMAGRSRMCCPLTYMSTMVITRRQCRLVRCAGTRRYQHFTCGGNSNLCYIF